MKIFASKTKYSGVYASGPNQGEPFGVGTLFTYKGKVIISDSQKEALKAWPDISSLELIELETLPDAVITVKEWLKGE